MQPLFTAQTPCTWPEYWKLNLAVLLHRRPMLALYLLPAALFVLLAVLHASALPLLLCLAFYAAFLALLRATAHRTFLSNRILRDQTLQYAFYPDRFEAAYNRAHASVAYDKLFAIWETRTNLYLMISRNQGYILCKADCPPGLIALLQSKKGGRA